MLLPCNCCCRPALCCSLVHLAERMPFHDAFYFVVTSLTTVGYGESFAAASLHALTYNKSAFACSGCRATFFHHIVG